MFASRTAHFVLFLSVAALGGCGSSDNAPGSTQAPETTPGDPCLTQFKIDAYSAGMQFKGASLTLTLDDASPAPPAQGDNTWTFELKDASGNAVSNATITASQYMVQHGHPGAKTITVTAQDGGTYKAEPVNFNMGGFWENFFNVTSGATTDKIDVKMCIP